MRDDTERGDVASYRVGHPAPEDSADAVRQSSLRSLNLATVIQRVFGATQMLSRADIAADTGLTRSTVSRLADDLIAGGLIAESEPHNDGHRGRPAVPLTPAPGTWFALGLEINVGRLSACLIDLTGHVIAEEVRVCDLRDSDVEPVIAEVAEMGRRLLAKPCAGMTLAGVQVALPGLVDVDERVLLRAPNLGWWNVRPSETVAQIVGVDVSLIGVGNEADCAAEAIAWDAPARPSDLGEFLYVSGEVGIGSALVTAGRAMTGRHGWAGEIGHVCVDRAGPVCACGATGCLEAYVGQAALSAAAGTRDTDELIARLHAGDPRALAAVEAAATTLGVVLAGALNLLDVSQVILGGHLGRLAPHLIPGIDAELRRRVVAAPFETLAVTSLPDDRGMACVGAAYLALHRVLNDPAPWLAS